MTIVSTGNIRGPEGVYKEFGVLTPGATFVYSIDDVVAGAFFVKTATGDAFSPANGAVSVVPVDQVVIEVGVTAQVTV